MTTSPGCRYRTARAHTVKKAADVLSILRHPLVSASSSPREAREILRDWLTAKELAALSDDAAVLVSELVTNAVLHGGEEIIVYASVTDEKVRVEVFDSDPRSELVGVSHSSEATSGRGLSMVDSMADDWGCVPAVGGTRTWFELATESPPT